MLDFAGEFILPWVNMKKQAKLLRPAEFIILYFGGLRPAARAIGKSHAAIALWRRSKKEGGTDGEIPRLAIHRILDLTKKHGWKITAYDLIFGRAK